MLGEKSKNVERFKKNLDKNGADFPVSYLLYISYRHTVPEICRLD